MQVLLLCIMQVAQHDGSSYLNILLIHSVYKSTNQHTALRYEDYAATYLIKLFSSHGTKKNLVSSTWHSFWLTTEPIMVT